MANKTERFYFENFIAATDASCKAAEYLIQCLKDYRPDRLVDMLKTMHGFEHAGDQKNHEMSAALAKAFVTPVDREDLALISQNIDEVTDKIEEVLQRFYMNHVEIVPPMAMDFAKKIADCCTLLHRIMEEFNHFKKPARLRQMIVELNELEESCDVIYLNAMRAAGETRGELWATLAEREIYESLEGCADACEHVGDCIEMVIMKNT